MHRLVKSSAAEQFPVPTLPEPEKESRMASKILILYGSYRCDRAGIRFAKYLVRRFEERGDIATLIDAKLVGLPFLDRMYKEYPLGEAPSAMEALAEENRSADAFVFVTGEYNWGVQPGLKNLTDHFLEEWFWRPAAIVSYSAGRLAGVRGNLAWHGTLSEMGMVVVSSTLTAGPISDVLDEAGQPVGNGGEALERSFPRFAEDLGWWTAAAKNQRALSPPPY
jgi:NAD(P)H-dependent FMN reductase